MKINSIEVDTDLGRRVIQLSPPVDFELTGDMPPHFRSLTEQLWGVLRQFAVEGTTSATPKVEA